MADKAVLVLLSEEGLFVIHEFHGLVKVHVREQRPGEVIVVPPADVGAEELLGDGNAVIETHLKRPIHKRRFCFSRRSHGGACVAEVEPDQSSRTHLLQQLPEGEEVDGVGVAERAVDVEQDCLQRRLVRQSAAASEFTEQRHQCFLVYRYKRKERNRCTAGFL